jgi:tetratricopeptide (TPR) repeat protein
MKKSVVITLVAVLVVLAVAAAITGWLVHLYHNTGTILLDRAELAMRADKWPGAMELAEKYIADNPKDWKGYYTKAKAQCGSKQFDEARKTLEQARSQSPKESAVYVLMAKTYSQGARATLDAYALEPYKALTPKRLTDMQKSLEKYDQAQEVLTAIHSADLDVLQELGTMQIEHATSEQWYARQMEDDALRAKAQRDEKTSLKRMEQSQKARDNSKKLLEQATDNMLKVVTQDPKRSEAASTLVELCLERQDDKSLALARQAIMKLDDPTPVAAMRLVMHELQSNTEDEGPINREKLTKACQVLEDILKKHPDMEKLTDKEKSDYNQVKLAKAELTLRLGDLPGTRKLCEEVLKAEPRNPRARMALAELLIQQNEFAEAEIKLSSLSKDFPNWPDSQFTYAKVALALGKKDLAIEALNNMAKLQPSPRTKLLEAELAILLSDMNTARRLVGEVLFVQPNNGLARLLQGNIQMTSGQLDLAQETFKQLAAESPKWPQVQFALAQVCSQTGDSAAAIAAAREAVKLDPQNAQARKLLTSLLLKESQFDKSFEEAKTSIEAHPDDPGAIRLYVEAAERNNHTDLALAMLAKCLKDYAKRPEVMMTVAEGYGNLNKRDKAVEAANLCLQGDVPTAQARLAVVRALMMLDRMPESEKMLSEEIKKEPDRADLHFQMGQICASTGRMLPAIDQLRKALELDSNNVGYRVSLARALLDSGDLGEANDVLGRIDPSNPTARVLRLQIQLMSGQQHVDMEQMLSRVQGSERSNIALTLPYLTNEQLQQCVAYCNIELNKTPDDVDLHLLLGRALLALGQQEPGIKQWEFVLLKAPDRLSTYLELASILSRDSNMEQVLERMSRIPGASIDMIKLAIGRMVAAMGDYEKASIYLSEVANRAEAPEHVRGRARLLLAQAMALAGHVDKALEEFQKLATNATWRKDAMFGKAQLLAGRKDDKEMAAAFDSTLADLRKIAQGDKDTSLLRNIAELYANNQKYDLAIEVCDELTAMSPEDARNYRMRAAILNLAKKYDEAIQYFDKSIERQPKNYSLYLAEEQIYDHQEKSVQALAELRKLEQQGESAAVIAMFQRGRLFASWGLQDQAADCYGKLSSLGYNGNPQVKMALGQSYAMLGRVPEAAKYLETIPTFAEEYVPSRLLLARLAPDAATRLQVVSQLQETQPLNESVLLEHMEFLASVGRMDECLKVYQAFIAQPKVKVLPEGPSFAALQVMLELGQEDQARDLAMRAVKDRLQPRWQIYAALLSLETKPDDAVKIFPAAEKTDIYTALLMRLYVSCKTNDKDTRDKCASRLSDLLKLSKSESAAASYKFLMDIALKNGHAKEDLARIHNVFGFGRSAADELLSSEAKNPKASEEALELILSGVAQSVQLPALSRLWAMRILQQRPTCQWAAVMGVLNNPRSEPSQKFLSILEPKDCPIARVIEAQGLANQRKFGQAVDVMTQACQTDDTPELLLRQAAYLEMAGKIEQAAAVQRKVWQTSGDPNAANNLAYLTLARYPADKSKIAEAEELIKKAIEARPDNPSFRDTLGWIYYLQGQYEQACMELRKAVKGQVESADVHYHLGMAEAACTRTELARWHLSAAVSISKALQAQKVEFTAQMKQTFELSQKALNLLGPEK